MMFVRQERLVQNVPRLGECLQEPLPRLGIPAVEQVTSPWEILHLPPACCEGSRRTRRWWAGRGLTMEDGRTSCLATPSKSTDLMLSLVYLKTPLLSFSHGMNEAENVLSSHGGPWIYSFTFCWILQFSLPLFLSLPIQSCLSPASHVEVPLLVWSFFLFTFICPTLPLPLKPVSLEKLLEGRSCVFCTFSSPMLRGFL